ncbi:carboxymuconolactone decarboxylase family protein [Pseudonocardia humida]|uniref:Carboxymuconolactone decarboxylase family protein n=1 Tax=Pseudonocardia humida TaxID=2800819 RepID=A0ABT0ZVF1_9PSEU|nr:carboxymuconolactone decarboxylase family protein [Pseudonocardia humida]MCO1654634.1 carboxymuconolactone decarboxylase family protein [Pseudonocardia humida]
MPRLHALEPDQAPSTAQTLLAGIIDRHGDAGPMVRTMAHSPALLQGYLDLSRAMKRSALPRPLSEKVSLAVQEWIGCALCLAAHTAAGRAAGLTDTDIDLARQGSATDAREAALITYAVRVLTEPASITDADVAELRGHGWSDRALADVVGLVALNQLTGSFNLVAGLEPRTAVPASP